MKPYNESRVIIEYARVHRMVPDGQGLFPLPPFIDDLAALLQLSVTNAYTAPWKGHHWSLGDAEVIQDGAAVCGKFGWSEEVADSDIIPPFVNGHWEDTIETTLRGCLAAFVVERDSQRVAITSSAGELSTAGFCHALTTLLNHQEISLRATNLERPGLTEWLVEPVAEVGVFRSWLSTVQRLKRISISFHLPNPDVDPELDAIVNGILNGSSATDGFIRVNNNDGRTIDPFGSPTLAAGIAMQEHNYGSINAVGETDGNDKPFKSAQHPAKDTVDIPAGDAPILERPVFQQIVIIMLEAIVARLRREDRGSDG